eukprot:6177913-Prymnesium_polylepis.1
MPSVRRRITFGRCTSSDAPLAPTRNASRPHRMPSQMLVVPRGRSASRASIAWSRPALVISPRAYAFSAMLSNATSAQRSCAPRVWITALTACLTMSRIVRPSFFMVPSSSSYEAMVDIDPEMSIKQQRSTGCRRIASATVTLTAMCAVPPAGSTSSVGVACTSICSPAASAAVFGSSTTSSPQPSSSSKAGSSIAACAIAAEPSTPSWLPSWPERKTRTRPSMRRRQMGHAPFALCTRLRHWLQPHWCPHGMTKWSASRSRQTTHCCGGAAAAAGV